MMQKGNFTVRKAQDSDLPWIKELADAHKRELGFLLRPALAKSIEKSELLVAINGAELLGFVHFHHRRDYQTTLYNIVVKPEHRGRGIGSQLIEELIFEATANGKRSILLKCPEELSANDFYRNLGWKRIDVERGKARRLNVWQIGISTDSQG